MISKEKLKEYQFLNNINSFLKGTLQYLEARVLTAITSAAGASDSTQATAIGVRIRYLPADGIGSSGSQSVFGMFDGRGDLGQGLDG